MRCRALSMLLVGILGCSHRSSAPQPIAETITATTAAPGARRTSPASLPAGVTTSAGAIALDRDRAYWLAVARSFERTDHPTRLLARPKAGGETVELAAVPTEAAPSLAIDEADVFFAHTGKLIPNPERCPPRMLCSRPDTIPGPTGAVVAIAKSGGPPRVIAAGLREPRSVAIDATHVYWTEGRRVHRAPKRGGPTTIVADEVSCDRMLLDATDVYCAGRGVLRLAKDGSRRALLGESFPVSTLALGQGVVLVGGEREVRRDTPREDDSRLQRAQSNDERWIDRVPRLAAIPDDGGPSRSLIEGVRPWWIVVEDRRVTWSSGSGGIHRIDIASGTAAEVEGAYAGSIEGLAVDEAQIYWVTREGTFGSVPR